MMEVEKKTKFLKVSIQEHRSQCVQLEGGDQKDVIIMTPNPLS